MRARSVFERATWLVALLSVAAVSCTSLLGDFERSGEEGDGSGGASSSGTTTTTGTNGGSSSTNGGSGGSGGGTGGDAASSSSSGSGGGCSSPSDCAGIDDDCQQRTCDGGVCGTFFTLEGTPVDVGRQIPGDCQVVVCDGRGGTDTNIDDEDVPDDQKECTDDLCNGGVPSHEPVGGGTACGAGLTCDGLGNCTGCQSPSECGADTECLKNTCSAGICGVTFMPADTPTSGQTSRDCKKNVCDGAGAEIVVDDDTDTPVDGLECTEDRCVSGLPTFTNQQAGFACSEGNGRVCDGAGVCVACLVATDCVGTGEICTPAHVCQQSCTTGVKDGSETDIDCGGQNCPPCAFGQRCAVGSDCKGEVCGSGNTCQVTVLATGQEEPTGVATDATHVYWANSAGSYRVSKLPLTGGTLSVLTSAGAGASDIARDSSGFVYYFRSPYEISKVGIGGGNPVSVFNGTTGLTDLQSDGQFVYFSNATAIRKAPVGGGTSTILASAESDVTGVFFDANFVYWTSGNPGTVRKVPVTGGSAVTIVSGQDYPADVVVDATSVYWTNEVNANGTVRKAALDGSGIVTLATGLARPSYIALDATHVYWTERTGGRVAKAPIGGGAVTVLAAGQDTPRGLALSASHVFWANQVPGSTTGTISRSLK